MGGKAQTVKVVAENDTVLRGAGGAYARAQGLSVWGPLFLRLSVR